MSKSINNFKFRLYSYSFCIITLLFINSCFLHGAPEKVADFAQSPRQISKNAPKARLLVAFPSNFFSGLDTYNYSRGKTLGSQYIFFVFPLTRLYFQHGVNYFFRETVIEKFHDLNFDICETSFNLDGEINNAILRECNPDFIIEPIIRNPRLNAYDLFFYRLLSIYAELDFNIYKWQEGRLFQVRKFTQVVDIDKFSKTGFANQLSRLFSEEISNQVDKVITSLRASRDVSKYDFFYSKSLRPFLEIERPEILKEISPELIELFNKSYGYKSNSLYSEPKISRVFQTAAILAVTKLKYDFLLTSRKTRFPETSLKIKIYNIEVNKEQLSIDMEILLISHNQSKYVILKKLRKNMQMNLSDNVDSSYQIAIEEATSQILFEFFKISPDS